MTKKKTFTNFVIETLFEGTWQITDFEGSEETLLNVVETMNAVCDEPRYRVTHLAPGTTYYCVENFVNGEWIDAQHFSTDESAMNTLIDALNTSHGSTNYRVVPWIVPESDV